MRLFIIDDNTNFANFICRHFRGAGIECWITPNIVDTLRLSNRILKLLKGDDVIFININLKIDDFRQAHKGIELLTWLRIKGAVNHCILYSFQTAEAIARSSEKNRLLFSRGTTFVQLPNDFSSINLKTLAVIKSEQAKLRENIKPLFNIGEFRHRNANWWGVKQLWDVHKIYREGSFNKPYPKNISDNLTNLNNAVGTFLYGLEVATLTNYIDSIAEEIEKIKHKLASDIDRIKSSKPAEHGNLSVLEEWETTARKQIQDIEDNFQKYFSNTSPEYQTPEPEKSIKNEVAEIQKEPSDISERISELQDDINTCERLLDKYRQTNSRIYEIAKKKLFEGIDLERGPKSRILLIDDNAENGWKVIFGEITGAKIKAFVPPKEFIDKPAQLYKVVKKIIAPGGFDPDLIMLDLRLFDELDRSVDVKNLSGTMLLQRIKRDFKGIPVMITAASNKIWTYQNLINLGADGYWIKEGIDEQRDAIDSVNNYRNLCIMVQRMTDVPYKLLRKLSDLSENFERRKENHWSAKRTWSNKVVTRGRTDEISASLSNATHVLKDHLRNHYISFDSDGADNHTQAFVLSGLINKIAGVYESVHDLKPGETAGTVGIEYPRRDKEAVPLIKLRNRYSHGNYQTADWEILKKCIEKTEQYLFGRK